MTVLVVPDRSRRPARPPRTGSQTLAADREGMRAYRLGAPLHMETMAICKHYKPSQCCPEVGIHLGAGSFAALAKTAVQHISATTPHCSCLKFQKYNIASP